jgi:hypothetical protein
VTLSGFFPVLLVWLLSLGHAEQTRPPNAALRETTVTATVDRVERFSRMVTLRGQDNVLHTVYVERDVTAFDDLKVGDVVRVRYIESVIVEVRPGAKPTPTQDTTQEARGAGNEHVVQQLKTVVTIESIDSQGLFLTYRTHDHRRIVHAVRDKALLEGIRPGDRVGITVTHARAVSIERERR